MGHSLSWVRIGLRPLKNWLRILQEMGLSEPGWFFSGLDWPTHQINQLQMIYSSQSRFLFKSKSSIAKLLKPTKEERGGPWKPIFKIVRSGKMTCHFSAGYSKISFSKIQLAIQKSRVQSLFQILRKYLGLVWLSQIKQNKKVRSCFKRTIFFSFPLIFPENQTVHAWFRC